MTSGLSIYTMPVDFQLKLAAAKNVNEAKQLWKELSKEFKFKWNTACQGPMPGTFMAKPVQGHGCFDVVSF